jgi:hypothetical protein
MIKTSKYQRQKWWRRLAPEQQGKYIDKTVSMKAVKRRKRSLRRMKKYGDTYKCSECFHRKTKSCTDDMPNGCEHWFNPNSEKKGIAYI